MCDLSIRTATSLPLAFTGELTDPTTSFLDLRARDLDPTLGRFLSRDTVSPNAPGSQGYNPYAYVANNPTTWVDPSGNDVMSFGELVNLTFAAELFTVLAINPELAGLVGVGIVVAVIFLGIAAILDCTLDTACRARFAHDRATIDQYGSAAAAGAWSLSGQATRFGWQHFPGLPTGPLCALGAAEGIATNAVASALGGNHSSASDTTLAAAMGCASGGSSGGGNGESQESLIRTIQIVERDGDTVTIRAAGPRGTIEVITDMIRQGDDLVLQGLHIDGPGAGSFGVSELREFARQLGREQGAQRVIIQGAERSTGANPGKIPRSITIEVR